MQKNNFPLQPATMYFALRNVDTSKFKGYYPKEKGSSVPQIREKFSMLCSDVPQMGGPGFFAGMGEGTTIGNALKMSKKTVMKYVKSLEDKGLITTEHTTVTLKSGQKQNGNLRYTIRPIKEAKEHFYRQQMIKLEFDFKNKNKAFLDEKNQAV